MFFERLRPSQRVMLSCKRLEVVSPCEASAGGDVTAYLSMLVGQKEVELTKQGGPQKKNAAMKVEVQYK